MNGSIRAVVAAGVVALTGGALVTCPPTAAANAEVTRPVVSTASVAPLVRPVGPPPAEELRSALTLVGHLAETGGASAEFAALADPVVSNVASSVIDDAYSVVRYWANYLALDLGPWALGWVPLGYLISDQIYIWYPTWVLPTADSFVYDFLDPVVNDVLNPAVWLDGINAVLTTAANGLVNGIVDEINYVLSLGWFPIPLPPLPVPPLPRLAAASTPAVAPSASREAAEIVTEAADESPTDDARPTSVERATTDALDEGETVPTAPPIEEPEPAAEHVEESDDESVAESGEEKSGEEELPAETSEDPQEDAQDDLEPADEPADDPSGSASEKQSAEPAPSSGGTSGADQTADVTS